MRKYKKSEKSLLKEIRKKFEKKRSNKKKIFEKTLLILLETIIEYKTHLTPTPNHTSIPFNSSKELFDLSTNGKKDINK